MSDQPDRLNEALREHYTIGEEIGRGGMATVYLAEDLKHHRQVAIKVLKPELAAVLGGERFLNEISVTAHLQHPHILPLFDSGAAEGFLYYVMPFVGGESLADKLRRERQLRVEEAVRIATEVASALDYAHRHDVIHRDIKPGNIMLLDGQAMVVDFGIALAVTVAGGDRITETGLSLGTPEYMSPEQATGAYKLDARSDIYSLGAVLYQMLAGEPPHTGPTVQAVVARVITDRPRSIKASRDTVPVHVAAAVDVALAKLPADRFASAREFADALRHPIGVTLQHEVQSIPARSGAFKIAAIVGWAAAAILLAITALVSTRTDETAGVRRWNVLLPDTAPLAFVGAAPLSVARPSVTIAPAGGVIAYVAQRDTSTVLYVRDLAEPVAVPIPGSDGAYQPFFSPDGQWIAFFSGSELKKVQVAGGRPTTLARLREPHGGDWLSNDEILVAEQLGRQLSRVSAVGGQPHRMEHQPAARIGIPRLLQDGEWILCSTSARDIVLFSLVTGSTLVLTSEGFVPVPSADVSEVDAENRVSGSDPRFVAGGFILYAAGTDGVLMAVPFDQSSRQTRGSPSPVLSDVRVEASMGMAHFDVSDNGTLIYAPGSYAAMSRFVSLANGEVDSLPFESRVYGTFRISPDGREVLVEEPQSTGRTNVWLLDLDRRTHTQLFMSERLDSYSFDWWPDGRHIVYSGASGGAAQRHIVRQLPSGEGGSDTLSLDRFRFQAVSHDGSRMLVGDSLGLWSIPSDGTGAPVFIDSLGAFGSFSPDGEWVAFTLRVTGRSEVYLRSASGEGERTRISPFGGEEAVWSPAGNELIYRNGRRWLAVRITSQNGRVNPSAPRLLFTGPYLQVPGVSHDVGPDGRHLLLLGPSEDTIGHLNVITGWYDELRELAPTRSN